MAEHSLTSVFCELVSLTVSTVCLDSRVSPLRRCWVKGVWVLWCNEPAALLAVWLGTVMCCCGNTGMAQTLNKEFAWKVQTEEENSPTTPVQIRTENLLIRSLTLYELNYPDHL